MLNGRLIKFAEGSWKEKVFLIMKKVFSIFEEHTEWISKGKAGISQETGTQGLHCQRSILASFYTIG